MGMGNKLILYSISELLGKKFFIPSYQRGYRWDKQQVEELLNDIYTFALKPNKSEKEFYCLQPIVVKKCSEEVIEKNNLQTQSSNLWYEVIDGQQRLTTIKILISYIVDELYSGKSLFEKHRKNPYLIDYETRKECNSFIEKSNYSDENIDFYFISEARKSINSWFENGPRNRDPQKAKEKIRNTLINNKEDNEPEGIIQVIWYEIEDNTDDNKNAIDTFIRINLGKIPLTSSELIKALFLQTRDFNKAKVIENEIAKLKQIQIANEWDKIENSLQNDDFWWFINKSENKIPSRIDFIFNLLKEIKISEDEEEKYRKSLKQTEIENRKRTNPTINERIGADSYSTFRYFYCEFDKQIDFDTLKKEWDSVQQLYLTLEEWYNNPVWYHYIGFLIYCGESIFNVYKLTKYHFETKVKITTKSEVTDSLIKKIKDHLKEIKWEKDSDEKYFLDISYGITDLNLIREILLLYNIENIVKQCKNNTLLYKFPFKSFKKIENGNNIGWDVEHIDSSTPNKLPNKESKIVWLKFALEEIEVNPETSQIIMMIKDFIENKNSSQDFEELKNKIIEMNEENEIDDDTKNNIGNLTLLDAGTNRGYGNALFPTKRKEIIKKDKHGIFIPICTKNVFLKYFDTTGIRNIKWTRDDILNYGDDIGKTLSVFLPEIEKGVNIYE
jgi:uncharacterized protein with ParB-like and HNH nuclease domain